MPFETQGAVKESGGMASIADAPFSPVQGVGVVMVVASATDASLVTKPAFACAPMYEGLSAAASRIRMPVALLLPSPSTILLAATDASIQRPNSTLLKDAATA